MLRADKLHDLAVDEGLCLRGAGQRCVAAQILVGDGLHGDHVELVAHAVAGDHGSGQACRLLDIIGGSGRDRSELHFLRGSSSGEGRDLVFDLLFAHQVMVALLLDLHGVAEGPRSAGNDRDLLDRRAVGLHGCHQGVSDFVVGDDELFLVREDGVLFLVAGDDDLYTLFHICLIGKFSAVANRAEGRFIDDVGELRAGGACRHAGDLSEVHIGSDLDLFRMDLEDIDSSLKVRQFHRDAPVKTAGSGQGGVERLGAVCRRQDDHSQILLETVHFRQQLVQGLLALIVSAERAAVTLFADRVDLIDEDDAGCLLFGLVEQVAHLGRAHADKHLHEFRAGHGEEGNVGLTGDRLGQHGLAGSGRSHQQDALGHGRADLLVFSGIVQILHDLHEIFLGFLFARDIREADAFGRFDIDLGVALAHAKHHRRGSASRPVHHFFIQIVPESSENRDWQDPVEQESRHRRCLGNNVAPEFRPRLVKPLDQTVIFHVSGTISFSVLVCKKNIAGPEFHFLDLLVLRHGHKRPVIHFLYGCPFDRRHDKGIDDHHKQYDEQRIRHHRFTGWFYFFHL